MSRPLRIVRVGLNVQCGDCGEVRHVGPHGPVAPCACERRRIEEDRLRAARAVIAFVIVGGAVWSALIWAVVWYWWVR